MRLSTQRVQGIIAACLEIIGPEVWGSGGLKLLLHGSRVDDSKRGGDIDLLLLSSNDHLEALQQKKRTILAAIGKKIGDCRIDLTIAPLDGKQQSDFVQSVLPRAVQLYPYASQA